jgi:hypothetical protein
MEPNKLSIKKIPVKQLIDTLVKLYEEGIDFIDLNGKSVTDTKDSLHIGVSPDYYKPVDDEEKEEPSKEYEQVILTQDDINALL